MRLPIFLILLPLAVLPASDVSPAATVGKVIDTCAEMPWMQGAWVSASGRIQLVADAPPGAEFAKCIEVEVGFPGKGFMFYNAEPARPLLIPGMLKSLSVWHRGPSAIVTLVDGWNRSEADGKKLEWNLATTNDEWRQSTFTIPGTWIQPIRVAGLAVHNWGEDGKVQTKRIRLSRLAAIYDLGDTEQATGALRSWKPDPDASARKDAPKTCLRAALLGLALTTGREANLFAG